LQSAAVVQPPHRLEMQRPSGQTRSRSVLQGNPKAGAPPGRGVVVVALGVVDGG
jgi:hypothetical protein